MTYRVRRDAGTGLALPLRTTQTKHAQSGNVARTDVNRFPPAARQPTGLAIVTG